MVMANVSLGLHYPVLTRTHFSSVLELIAHAWRRGLLRHHKYSCVTSFTTSLRALGVDLAASEVSHDHPLKGLAKYDWHLALLHVSHRTIVADAFSERSIYRLH